jgi:AcrR family transcriptional regulator
MIIAGLGIRAAFIAATTTALAHVEPRDAGVASGLVNTGHRLAGVRPSSLLPFPAVDATGATRPQPASDEQPAAPRRRADAERNIAAILDAAVSCFAERPRASMADIARAAGVGRVTLYAHFPSRTVLLNAALERAIAEAGTTIDAEMSDDDQPDRALGALVGSSWRVLDRYRRLYEAAQQDLSPERLRHHHDPALARVEALIARGRAEGVFRTDLPLGWQVTTFYSLIHAAADDVNAGRLDAGDAAHVLETTLLSALAPARGHR